jgi:hypothetical protein
MGYSVRVPLWFGQLKIKSESRVRSLERYGVVPSIHIGQTWIIWQSRANRSNVGSNHRGHAAVPKE